jgi:serine/threonine protein kinase
VVMELLEGETLRARLLRLGPLPIATALAVARQTLSALAYAHARGVVHRDIKPENLVLLPDDLLKVADFGLARDGTGPTVTVPGEILGTPYYIAPEALTGQRVDGRADLYSFGATMFHLLTGAPPFEGASIADVIRAHVQEPAPKVRARRPDAPAALAIVVERLLAKTPEARYPTADVALAALGG